MKIKTIYQQLKPEIKRNLVKNAKKYSSAKRLKYTLMSKTVWCDLLISDISTLILYGDVSTYNKSYGLALYGDNILIGGYEE